MLCVQGVWCVPCVCLCHFQPLSQSHHCLGSMRSCVSLSLTDFPMLSELYSVTRMSSCANMLERRTLTSNGSAASNLGTMLDAQAKRVETFDHTCPYAHTHTCLTMCWWPKTPGANDAPKGGILPTSLRTNAANIACTTSCLCLSPMMCSLKPLCDERPRVPW